MEQMCSTVTVTEQRRRLGTLRIWENHSNYPNWAQSKDYYGIASSGGLTSHISLVITISIL